MVVAPNKQLFRAYSLDADAWHCCGGKGHDVLRVRLVLLHVRLVSPATFLLFEQVLELIDASVGAVDANVVKDGAGGGDATEVHKVALEITKTTPATLELPEGPLHLHSSFRKVIIEATTRLRGEAIETEGGNNTI